MHAHPVVAPEEKKLNQKDDNPESKITL